MNVHNYNRVVITFVSYKKPRILIERVRHGSIEWWLNNFVDSDDYGGPPAGRPVAGSRVVQSGSWFVVGIMPRN